MKNTPEVESLFELLGLEDIDAQIFILLCQIGNQPASTLARRLDLERTKAYRHLQKMSALGVIHASQSKGVTTFYVDDTNGLEQLIESKTTIAQKLEDSKSPALDYIRKISRSDLRVPKIRLYERAQEIQLVFTDIIEELKRQRLYTVRMFASNTFDEKQESSAIGVSLETFFGELERMHISIETFLGSGGLVMERIERTTKLKQLLDLPTTPSSIHVFIIGYIVYIIIYRDEPVAIKIENDLFADVFHLLLDQVQNLGGNQLTTK